MTDDRISLYFQLKPGEKADLEVVARASLAWVGGMRASARALDPEAEIRVQIVDADESSLILNAVIDWFANNVEPRLERLERGGSKLPRTKKLAIATAAFLLFTGPQTYDFYFGSPDFTEEDRELLKSLAEQAAKDPEVVSARKQFYRTVEADPAITAIGIKELPDAEPVALVPSNQFAEAGGLWEVQPAKVEPRITNPIVDVVLVRPTLTHTPRPWTFKVEGLPEFEAVMRDPVVLEAIGEGKYMEMAEGIPMRLRLEVKEEFVDGEWKVPRYGRSVIRVLSPGQD